VHRNGKFAVPEKLVDPVFYTGGGGDNSLFEDGAGEGRVQGLRSSAKYEQNSIFDLSGQGPIRGGVGQRSGVFSGFAREGGAGLG